MVSHHATASRICFSLVIRNIYPQGDLISDFTVGKSNRGQPLSIFNGYFDIAADISGAGFCRKFAEMPAG
jgi:hypothetical protein